MQSKDEIHGYANCNRIKDACDISISACGRRPATLIDMYIYVNDFREVP